MEAEREVRDVFSVMNFSFVVSDLSRRRANR
jgi:hypothetical protein